MKWISVASVAVVLLGGSFASAGLFSKKPKPNPADLVFQNLKTLQNDPKSGRREDAAEELREFDPQMYPEIIPALIEALQKDSDSGVRKAAAKSLGRLRPESLEVAQALGQARANDSAMTVRLQARASLMGYRPPQPPAPPPVPEPRKGPTPQEMRLRPVPLPSMPAPAPVAPAPVAPAPVAPAPRPLTRPPAEGNAGPVLIPALPNIPVEPVRSEGPALAPPRPPGSAGPPKEKTTEPGEGPILFRPPS